MTSEYFDAVDGARMLGVERATIHSWVRRGHLVQGRFKGGRLLWTSRELQAARLRADGQYRDDRRGEGVELIGSRGAWLRVESSPGASFVYYVGLGSVVRIGVSRNVRDRLADMCLLPANLLAVTAGGPAEQSEVQRRFSHLRAVRDWFHLRDDLASYVEELQRQCLRELVAAGS